MFQYIRHEGFYFPYAKCAVFEAVSYSHLDVYKRQMPYCNTLQPQQPKQFKEDINFTTIKVKRQNTFN